MAEETVLLSLIHLLEGRKSKWQKGLAADTKTDRCMCKELKWNKLSPETSSAGGQVLLPWNGTCEKSPLCPLKEWHHSNFLSQKQVLLGAIEIMLPGFL